MNKKTISEVMFLVEEMAKQKKGSFFIVTKDNISSKYELLYPDLFLGKDVSIFDKSTKPVLLALAETDGAIIINDDGRIIAYGAKIKKTIVLFGHGTRHSAARGISTNKNVVAIISSEEDGQIRIFKEGKLLAEINPETGKDRKFMEKIGELISKPDLQVATAGGVSSLLLGLNPILAGAIFTGSFIITKYGIASIKEFVHTGKIIVKNELKATTTKKNIKLKNKKSSK
ncbi:MAG: diadenylate cyclase [archaeon]